MTTSCAAILTYPLVTTHGPIAQSTFLKNMGLHVRVDALVRSARTQEQRNAIQQAADRLVDPAGMGVQYQIMGITGGKDPSKPVWPFLSNM